MHQFWPLTPWHQKAKLSTQPTVSILWDGSKSKPTNSTYFWLWTAKNLFQTHKMWRVAAVKFTSLTFAWSSGWTVLCSTKRLAWTTKILLLPINRPTSRIQQIIQSIQTPPRPQKIASIKADVTMWGSARRRSCSRCTTWKITRPLASTHVYVYWVINVFLRETRSNMGKRAPKRWVAHLHGLSHPTSLSVYFVLANEMSD